MTSIDMGNPAQPSKSLAGLFPPEVAVTELREPGLRELLLPEEAVYLGRSVDKRVGEFAAGRLCARRALSEFGIVDFPIAVGSARQPIWADGFVGSITHTAGFCAAAVTRRSIARSLGIDTEHCMDVKRDLWPSICSRRELDWLGSVSDERQTAAAALIFSAKEAFYKCQYPLTAEFLGFQDVTVESGADGAFSVRPTRRIAFERVAAFPWAGRYREHEQYLTAGVLLKP